MTKALTTILEQGPYTVRRDLDDWTIEKFEDNDVIFFKGKNYIPRDDNLRWDITRLFHDHETAGHPGELETYNAIRQHYWWPGLRTYVKNYVQGCGICQQFKINRTPSRPTYLPRKVPHQHDPLPTVPWTLSLIYRQ